MKKVNLLIWKIDVRLQGLAIWSPGVSMINPGGASVKLAFYSCISRFILVSGSSSAEIDRPFHHRRTMHDISFSRRRIFIGHIKVILDYLSLSLSVFEYWYDRSLYQLMNEYLPILAVLVGCTCNQWLSAMITGLLDTGRIFLWTVVVGVASNWKNYYDKPVSMAGLS